MKNLQKVIQQIAEENLPGEEYFIVEVNVSAIKGPSKISILMDGDNGVTIDDCVALSRAVGNILEEQEIMESKYTLEVTSPGVDHPLSSIRQYKKNIGRKLKVTNVEGKDIKGLLKNVKEDKILLDMEIKKGKKISYEPLELAYSDIKKTIVQVSFK